MEKDKSISTKKQLINNLAAQITALAVQIGINFFLSSYLVKNIGSDAYGFVGLANNFVNYAQILTIAINSMAARYISISIHRKEIGNANTYFSTVLVINYIFIIIMIIPTLIFVLNLNKIINIPIDLTKDVQLLCLFAFINFYINSISNTYGISIFAKNKLNLESQRNIISYILSGTLLILIYKIFNTHVWYLTLVSVICTLYTLICNIHFKRKFIPEVKFKKKYFDIKAAIEISLSGIWNTISQVGLLLTDGFDLIICNIFISASAMGTLSIAKTVPSLFTMLVATLTSVFMPVFTINYAKRESSALNKNIKLAMDIMAVIVNVPLVCFIVLGNNFYSLWMPSLDSEQLQLLSLISCATLIINGGVNCIYNIFIVTNKLKVNTVTIVISGILNIIIVSLLLKFSNLGIYAVAGVSTCLAIIKNLFIIIPYSAKCLNYKWYKFYPNVMKSIMSVFIGGIAGVLIKRCFILNTWMTLSVAAFIILLASLIINILIFFDKEEINVSLKYLNNKITK
jgi:O-antigen/teichoic acid export membrane protein